MSSAERFLALLQREAHNDVDPAVFTTTVSSLTAKLREDFRRRGYPMEIVDRAIKEFAIDPDNPRIHPADRTILPVVLDHLEAGARFRGLQKNLLPLERPTFGSLPSGEVNAMTIKVPRSDDFVIVMEGELMVFANLVAKAIAPPFAAAQDGRLDPDRVRKRLPTYEESLRSFTEVVLAYAQHGRPSMAPQHLVDKAHGIFAVGLVHAMEKFVVGHELGHVVKGHLTEEDSGRERRVVSGQAVESVRHSWMQEFQADQHGLVLSFASAEGQSAQLFASGGADLFFSTMDVMDRATSLLRTGDEEALTLGSHPPASQRRMVLREYLNLLLEQATGSTAGSEEMRYFAQCLQAAVDALWEHARPVIARAHADGVRPAPGWRQVDADQ